MEKGQSPSKTMSLIIIIGQPNNNEEKSDKRLEKFSKTIKWNDTAMKNKNQIVRQLVG